MSERAFAVLGGVCGAIHAIVIVVLLANVTTYTEAAFAAASIVVSLAVVMWFTMQSWKRAP